MKSGTLAEAMQKCLLIACQKDLSNSCKCLKILQIVVLGIIIPNSAILWKF